MKRSHWSLLALLSVLVIMGAVAGAAIKTAQRFEPVFRVMQISGDVSVQKPGEVPTVDQATQQQVFPRATEMKAYPYGSRITTGVGSSVNAYLTRFSWVTVQAGASVIMTEDAQDKRIKVMNVETGKVEFMLEKGIEENGNSVRVEVPGCVCLATNLSRFSVMVEKAGPLYETTVFANEMNIRVLNPQLFEIYMNCPEKGKEKGALVTSSPDVGYVRVTGLKGDFGIKVKNPPDPEEEANNLQQLITDEMAAAEAVEMEGLTPEEGYKLFKLEPGVSVKMNQRKHSPTDAHVVAMLVVTNGIRREEITYNELKEGAEGGQPEAAVEGGLEATPAPPTGEETKAPAANLPDLPALDLPVE